MILNHCYRFIKYSFILCFSLLLGKSYFPKEIDLSENLIDNEREREYFLLYKGELNYEIEGPIRLEIISGRAIPEKSKRKYEFGYTIMLNDSKPIRIKHKKYKKDNMFSEEHTGHGYTQSGNTIINLPSGKHNLKMIPTYQGKPTLVRIIKEIYKRSEGITEVIFPFTKNNDVLIFDDFIIKNKKRKYFHLKNDQPLFLISEPNELFSIYGRTNNYSNHSRYSFYQIEILEGRKQKHIIVDYFLDDKIVKKKKIYQLENNKESELSLRLIDSSVPVYLRIIKNTPYE